MKAIKKLKIVLGLIIFFILAVSFYFLLKRNLVGGLIYLIIILIFILLRLTIFKKKFKGIIWKKDYNWIPIGYSVGAIILFSILLMSFGSISDLIRGHSIPLWAILTFFIILISGILLIYYSYQAKKESKSIKQKPKKEQ